LESKANGGIDLHIHSTASDGTYEPAELLQMAARLGLEAIAITDHDILDGSRLAFLSERPPELKLISGVEISVNPPADCQIDGSMHVLGYGIDLYDQNLSTALAELLDARDQRIPAILMRLHQIGIGIDLAQVKEQAGEGAIGRPHVANVLIDMGAARDIDDAFNKYLANGRPAYVDKYRLDCPRAFDLIRSAGGVPVLAHPFLIRSRQANWMAPLFKRLADLGLMGVEAYYSKHPPETVAAIKSVARQYGLLITGGSDFHGELTPEVQMGRGLGDLFVPGELFEDLIASRPNMSVS
jgi:3',5'-nucleoside bisphosphate phosphatase